MRGAFLLGVSGSLVLGVAQALAAEVDARGPSECPDSSEIAFRVERNVGVSLEQAPAVKFAVVIERAAAAYVARIAVRGPSSVEVKERVLTSATCNELADAIVVAVTLALGVAAQSDASARSPEEPATESGTGPAALAPTSVAPAAVAPAEVLPVAVESGEPASTNETLASSLRPSLSVSLLVDAGSLPQVGLGAALAAELGWERLQIRAIGTILFERHAELRGEPGAAPGADLELFTGSLLACTFLLGDGRSRLAVPGCLGLELGRLAGVGTGVVSPRDGSALWLAPRLDVGASWTIPGSAFRVGTMLMAATPLERGRFELTGFGTVYRPPSVVGRLSLGIGVGFD